MWKVVTACPLIKTSILIAHSKENVQRINEVFARVEKALSVDDTSKLPACYGNMNREEAFLEGLKLEK